MVLLFVGFMFRFVGFIIIVAQNVLRLGFLLVWFLWEWIIGLLFHHLFIVSYWFFINLLVHEFVIHSQG